jgi:hypothetical protein
MAKDLMWMIARPPIPHIIGGKKGKKKKENTGLEKLFFFFFSFLFFFSKLVRLVVKWVEDHTKERLAKFGYRLERK